MFGLQRQSNWISFQCNDMRRLQRFLSVRFSRWEQLGDVSKITNLSPTDFVSNFPSLIYVNFSRSFSVARNSKFELIKISSKIFENYVFVT